MELPVMLAWPVLHVERGSRAAPACMWRALSRIAVAAIIFKQGVAHHVV